ncbi:MAG: glycosyltransferase family 4 protein [bacterium]
MSLETIRFRLAIDARRLVRRMSGIGHYVFSLARLIPQLAPDFEVHLLLDRSAPRDKIPAGCREVVLGRYLGDGTTWAKLYSPFWLNLYVPHYLSRAKIDLFHGANFVLPQFVSCRTVATVHDISFLKIPSAYGSIYRRYMRLQTARSLHRANAIITGSEQARDDLINVFKAHRERIVVIQHGIDEDFHADYNQDYLYQVRRALNLPERYILHVGVVEVKKNIATLIEASAPLIKSGMVDAVVLAGRDGLGADEIRRRAKVLGLEERAHFLGFVSQNLLPGVYIGAKVVVFPSRYEGFGMPVLEAMACGTPVITSNVSSLPEVAGDAALLVAPDNPEELGQALVRVLTDERLRDSLREKGLRRAQEFSWEKAVKKHIEVYRQVLEERVV